MTDFRKFYYAHGVLLSQKGNQLAGDCPFCGKGGTHFFVATKKKPPKTDPGMYKCHRCGAYGNTYSFLRELHERSLKTTRSFDDIACDRYLGEPTIKEAKICKSYLTGRWLIPSYNSKGGLSNLYQVYKSTDKSGKTKYDIRSSPDPCQQQLYRVNTLRVTHKKLWICEGHWDALAWLEVLAHLSERNGKAVLKATADFDNQILQTNAVVGVPGASTWKDGWTQYVRNKVAILMFDNDKGGQNGMRSLVRKIEGEAHMVMCLHWKDSDAQNDIRDLLIGTGLGDQP